MRLWALIGAIVLLVLPFAIIHTTVGDSASSTSSWGLLWFSEESDGFFFDTSHSESIQGDWFDDGGLYHSYFGGFWYVGILILVLLVAAIGLSITVSKDRKRIPGILILISSVLLLLFRFLELSDADIGFYESTDVFLLGTVTRLEIPLGFIIGLIFFFVDLRSE